MPIRVVATNRKARYDYAFLDLFEAGLVLVGSEVKTLRQGRASLLDGYAFIKNGEAWLDNVHIPEYGQASWTNHSPKRARKLLMHRKELNKISPKLYQSGLTLVPTRLYFKNGRVKVELALARGKHDWDKRQAIRERQDRREAQRAVSSRSWR